MRAALLHAPPAGMSLCVLRGLAACELAGALAPRRAAAVAAAAAATPPASEAAAAAHGHALPSTASVPEPTPFWERKLAKRFKAMDFNSDGYVCAEDLEGHLDLVRATVKDGAPSTLERLQRLYYAAWKRVWSFGVNNARKRVSQREFMRGYTHVIKSPPAREDLRHTIEALLGGCFDAFDEVYHGGRAAGSMSRGEFVQYKRCWNLTEAEGDQLFTDIAGEGADRLSRRQYLLAAWDFYFTMGEEIKPGDNFWGRVRARRATHLAL